MRCRSVSRDLLPRVHFSPGRDSHAIPNAEHLLSCAACRREWEINRALGVQLERALRARVDDVRPSSITWQLIRQRVLDPDDQVDQEPRPESAPDGPGAERPMLAAGWWTQPPPPEHSGRPAMSEWIVWSGRTPKFGL